MIPDSGDIRVEDLGNDVPRTMYLDFDSDQSAIVKFAGSEITELMGYGVLGNDLFDYASEDLREPSKLIFGAMTSHPCGMWMVQTVRGGDQLAKDFELVYLPVEHSEKHKRFLASSHPLQLDYRPEDMGGNARFLGVKSVRWIDIGNGTPHGDPVLSSIKVITAKDAGLA